MYQNSRGGVNDFQHSKQVHPGLYFAWKTSLCIELCLIGRHKLQGAKSTSQRVDMAVQNSVLLRTSGRGTLSSDLQTTGNPLKLSAF
ncbi:unnamed protein product [Gadus morhua 'NCC']